eukprot:UN21533
MLTIVIFKFNKYLTNTSEFIITFPFEIPMKKCLLTNQMKNEYFQENEKKTIEITREMILFDDPNEIIERKSKTEGK